MFKIEAIPATEQHDDGFIGGSPLLPVGSDWPRCKLCDEEMTHFLDIVLPESEGTNLQAQSRLQIFACRAHDDMAGDIYSAGANRYTAAMAARRLPQNYWDEVNDGHYLLRLLTPKGDFYRSHGDDRLLIRNLKLIRNREDNASPYEGLKLFGTPLWLQDPELHDCSCGAPMQLLLQIPEGFAFDMMRGALEQPNSFSKEKYCLFLGSQLYLLACSKQCHPLALWPVLQN